MDQGFEKLKVWQKAHNLVLDIYKVTAMFPKEEIYGLTSQIRRAASSTAANIVEGRRRQSVKDFCHFLNIAQTSNEEVKYFLILSKDLQLLPPEKAQKLLGLADEIGAMLYGFLGKLLAEN